MSDSSAKASYKRHILGTLYTVIYIIPTSARGLILIPILTRNLDLTAYGILVTCQTLISLLSSVTGLGLQGCVSRFFPAKKDTAEGNQMYSSFFWFEAGTNLVVLAALLAMGGHVSTWTEIPRELLLIVGLAVFSESIFSLALEYFRAVEQSGVFLFLAGSKVYVELLALAFAAGITHQLAPSLTAILAVSLLYSIGVGGYVLFRVSRFGRPRFEMKRYLAFSLPNVVRDAADWVINLSDRMLITSILGARSAGIYNPPYALGSAVLFVPTAISTLMPPLMARLHDNQEHDAFQNIIRYSLKYFLILGIPMFFGGIVLSEPLLRLLSNPEVAREGWAITPIVILSCVFLGSARLLVNVLLVKLEVGAMMRIWIIAAAVNLGLNWVLLPRIGLIGGALATLIAFAWVLLAMTRVLRRAHPISLRGLGIPGMIGASVLMVVAVAGVRAWVLPNMLAVNLILSLVAAGVVYFGALLPFGVMGPEERAFFSQKILARFRRR